MNRRNLDLILGLVVFPALLAFLWGCASYGKLRPQKGPGEKMTVEQLVANRQNYHVLFAGVHRKLPSAVLFDRKDDNITVKGDRWFPVEDQGTLKDLIEWVEHQQPIGIYYPRLWEMQGPDGDLYGYMFTAWTNVVMKIVDENTVEVQDLPLPPYLAVQDRNGNGK
jgi:hypothetical protein